jgi:peptidoglycan L-alanyl-D-glutamate endopeptidase CwlK
MRDANSIQKVKLLHPKVRDEVSMLITKIEDGFPETVKIRIVQGLRTIDEQNALYAQGRTKPGAIVTNAKGGSSYHNYGLAIDFAIMYDKDGNGSFETLSWDLSYDFDKDGIKDWQEVVKAFKDAGWKWGGDWTSIKDNPHLEKTFDHNWKELLEKYKSKDFIPNTNYVNI